MSKKEYRILESTGSKLGDKWYAIEKKRKFLWMTWWSTVHEEHYPEISYPLYFRVLEDAQDKLKELENEYSHKAIK